MRIEITDAMRQAIAAVAEAERACDASGDVPYSEVELPKLDLADAVIAAVASGLARLPRRPVMVTTSRPKRSRTRRA